MKEKNITKKKETLFEIRRIVSQEIKGLFSELKSYKEKRDELTAKVKELKTEREVLNTELKKSIPNQEKIPVAHIKKEIDKMQYYIETTPLSPEKEKAVMKEIKEKEKLLAKSKQPKLSPKLEQVKDTSNEVHAKIQDFAKTSQEYHEKIIQISKDIKILKAREKDIHNLFTDAKEKYKSVKETPVKKSVSARNEETLKERQNEVEEKIKKKQKLTTEDLLAFRG